MSNTTIEQKISQQQDFGDLSIKLNKGYAAISQNASGWNNQQVLILNESILALIALLDPEREKRIEDLELTESVFKDARKFVGAGVGESIEDKFIELQERNKQLEESAKELFHMVHESGIIENKIRANELYESLKLKP